MSVSVENVTSRRAAAEVEVRAPALVLLGVNHNSAPLELRERLAIPETRLPEATRALVHQPGVREAMIVSTCNRVELLTSLDSTAPRQKVGDSLRDFLRDYFAVSPTALAPHLYEFHEREAVRHLFRVTSSLDSLVVGEAQILGQVKDAWSIAREVGAVAGALDPLLQRAFSVAKRVRTETAIGSSSVSIASVAVDLARKIFGTLQGKHVLIVGAGKMAELAARHLIQHGASAVSIANRTEARARQLAEALPGRIMPQMLQFDQLSERAHEADIVITSTGAGAGGRKLFTPAQGRLFLERRRNKPMFFIDIAVPRDVDPMLNEVEGCFVYDIDDLQGVAAANLANRSREAEAAEAIVSREVERYQERLSTLDAAPVLRALQETAEALRQAEMARSAGRLGLTAAQTEAMDAMTRSLTAKLLQAPITAIRAAASEGDAGRLEQLRALYARPGSGESRDGRLRK